MGNQVYNQVQEEMKRLVLADAEDVTTYLNGGTISENASGLVFGVTTGIKNTPQTATTAIWRATSVIGDGASVAAGQLLSCVMATFIEFGSPDLNSDSYLSVGLLNDSDLSIADGVMWRIVYTGGVRKLEVQAILNGAESGQTLTAAAAVDRFYGISSQLSSEDAHLWFASIQGYLSDFANTRVSQGTLTNNKSVIGDIYIVVSGGRTAATAGGATVSGNCHYCPTQGITLPS